MMKKTLLGTTALVAAAVAVSGARAQDDMMAEPISLTVGGYSYWGVHVASGDYFDTNEDQEGLGIAASGEVHFKGSTVLDNGLEVGVRFELEGENHSDQMDETYAYVEGSFGTLRIGNDDAASYQMATAAPYATYLYGANTPYWAGSISTGNGVGWHSTFVGGPADSASLMYFTPVVNGFQLGLSYAPEAGTEAGGAIAANTEGNEMWSIAARYDGSFSEENSVTLAVGMVDLNEDTDVASSEGATAFSAGLVLSRGGVSVGGSYANRDDGSDDDNVTYDLGASYGAGPWTVSLTWLHNEDDDTDADNDLYRLLGSYDLGAGVNVAGALGIDKPDNGNDVTYLGAAMAINF